MSIDDYHPAEWAELPGTFEYQVSDSGADFFAMNRQAIMVAHKIRPGLKFAAWMPISTQVIVDVGWDRLTPILLQSMDRFFRPWLYPDRYEWSAFDPFPRWTRFVMLISNNAERLRRGTMRALDRWVRSRT